MAELSHHRGLHFQRALIFRILSKVDKHNARFIQLFELVQTLQANRRLLTKL